MKFEIKEEKRSVNRLKKKLTTLDVKETHLMENLKHTQISQ